MVPLTTKEKDDGTEQEDHGRKSKCKIIAIVLHGVVGINEINPNRMGNTDLLNIWHGDLADHCANANEEVEILEIQSVILATRARKKRLNSPYRCEK